MVIFCKIVLLILAQSDSLTWGWEVAHILWHQRELSYWGNSIAKTSQDKEHIMVSSREAESSMAIRGYVCVMRS